MAISTPQANNVLVKFTKQINFEYVRQNLFSPYMGEDMGAIIRIRRELTDAGNQMNIPLVAALSGPGVGSGPLVGNEEKIDDYGMRLWIDYARNAVVSNKSARRKDSASVFDEARSLLGDWGKSKQRDEIVDALYALPSESAPINLDTSAGQRVNGIQFQAATAAQRNTWVTDNVDRVLFGKLVSNYSTHVRHRDRQPRHDRRPLQPRRHALAQAHRQERHSETAALQDRGRPRILRRLPRHPHLPRSQAGSRNHQQGRPPARRRRRTRSSRTATCSMTA